MRGTWFTLAVGLLGASLLAGCLGGDELEPEGEVTFEDAEGQARAAVDDGDGEWVLVGAFGLSANHPGRLEEISADYPGIAALARPLLASARAPSEDGKLPAWAYLYEAPPGTGPLRGVVVLQEAGDSEAVEAFSDRGDAWVLDMDIARSELQLLGSNATYSSTPTVGSKQALETARSASAWDQLYQSEDALVLYTLSAGPSGLPEWRMVAAEARSLEGLMVRVNATSAGLEGGPYVWPESAVTESQIDHTATRMPGDEHEFTFQVENATHPALNIYPQRTATGSLIGDPEVVLVAPGAETTPLTLHEWHNVEGPSRGEWTVRYTWELPDVSRSIQLHTCLEPRPFLFAEDLDEEPCPTGGEFSADRL